jgi:hypothetical protein
MRRGNDVIIVIYIVADTDIEIVTVTIDPIVTTINVVTVTEDAHRGRLQRLERRRRGSSGRPSPRSSPPFTWSSPGRPRSPPSRHAREDDSLIVEITVAAHHPIRFALAVATPPTATV